MNAGLFKKRREFFFEVVKQEFWIGRLAPKEKVCVEALIPTCDFTNPTGVASDVSLKHCPKRKMWGFNLTAVAQNFQKARCKKLAGPLVSVPPTVRSNAALDPSILPLNLDI